MNSLSSANSVGRDFSDAHYGAWTLLLLKSLHKAGLTPGSNRLVHRVLFLGNSLAKLYSFSPPQELVQQHPRGPFYPRAQFQLDRLCVLGLATVSDIEYKKLMPTAKWDQRVLIDRVACYDISTEGFNCALTLEKDISWAAGCSEFLFDLCLAFVNITPKHALELERVDPNYVRRGIGDPYRVNNFSDYHDNLTRRTLDQLRAFVPSFATPSRSHALRLFTEYLDRLAA